MAINHSTAGLSLGSRHATPSSMVCPCPSSGTKARPVVCMYSRIRKGRMAIACPHSTAKITSSRAGYSVTDAGVKPSPRQIWRKAPPVWDRQAKGSVASLA